MVNTRSSSSSGLKNQPIINTRPSSNDAHNFIKNDTPQITKKYESPRKPYEIQENDKENRKISQNSFKNQSAHDEESARKRDAILNNRRI